MKFNLGVFAALTALCAPGASTTDAFVPRHPGRTFIGSGSSKASTTSSSSIEEVTTRPIPGMKPGTSGLRKKVEVWQGTDDDANKYYVENFIQSLLDTATARNGGNVPTT